MNSEDHVAELDEAARRAGYIVTEQIDMLLEKAQQEAEAIRRDAERDAEDIRREAVSSAERLLGRLQALEFPLGQLVANLRDEAGRVTKELESPHLDSHATALPPADEGQGGDHIARHEEDEEGVETGPHGDDVGGVKPSADPAAHQPTAADPAPAEARNDEAPPADVESKETPFVPQSGPATWEARVEPPATEPAEPHVSPSGKGSRRGRRKPKTKKGKSISAAESCAICQRKPEGDTEEELAADGWKVNGDVALCPECQADRWQLPEGARLPFRRGST